MIELHPYQQEHANKIRESLLANGFALDHSDTGTGKTPVAAAVTGTIRYRGVLVVCPLAVKNSWNEWMAKVPRYKDCYAVVNWEKLRTGKTPFLKRRGKKFDWQLENDCIIIWDECHMAKGRNTLNSKMVMAAKDAGIPSLLLSATPFQNPIETQALGYVLGLHDGRRGYWSYCNENGCYKDRWGGMSFNGSRAVLARMHQSLEHVSSRMSISEPEVSKHFGDNVIVADAYNVDSPEQINEAYISIQALSDLDERIAHDTDHPLTESLRHRQTVELLKLPVFKHLITESLGERRWPVVFLNFRDTAKELSSMIGNVPICDINGEQSSAERARQIEAFQSSTEPTVMLATISAGGVGVSLHDTHGERPRTSLISPTYNAIQFKQALGRIHRSGMKSYALQKLIYAAGTIEEKVCKAVQRKIQQIDTINDDDLQVTL